MATKETGGASTVVGKVGKIKQEGRQRKLIIEQKEKGKEVGKKVTFRLEEDGSDNVGRNMLEELRKEFGIRIERELSELRKEKEKYKEYFKELNDKEKVLENKLEALEEKFNGFESWIKERIEKLEVRDEMDSVGTGDKNSRDNSEGKSVGGRTRSSFYASTGTLGTLSSVDGLSNREVGMIRKWVMEKEKEERKCNIVFEMRQ